MGRAKRIRVKRLPEKLLQIRNTLNLSQNELIKELGLEDLIYQNNVSGYESGEREPPLPFILAYAQLAGISTDFLIDDELDLPDKLRRKTNKTTSL
jgi:transcriptional regulator with XRE-family HTH domain